MILMIDNYDSFTWNLVQYLGELGAEVKVFRNDEITAADIAAMKIEGIVISPGPCTPNEAGISLAVIREFAGKIPILGVCLGHQAIGQAFGGEVAHAVRVVHGNASRSPQSPRTARSWECATAVSRWRACSSTPSLFSPSMGTRF